MAKKEKKESKRKRFNRVYLEEEREKEGFVPKELNSPDWIVKLKARADNYSQRAQEVIEGKDPQWVLDGSDEVPGHAKMGIGGSGSPYPVADYYRAGNLYTLVGEFTKAIQSYKEGIECWNKGLHGQITPYDFNNLIKKTRKKQEKVKKMKSSQLESRASAISLIIGILAGIFFLSPNLTGNAISNLTNQTSNIIGGGLFLIGIIGGLMWFKKR